MNRTLLLLLPAFMVVVQSLAAAEEKEWLTDEETGKQIFERQVILPPDVVPKIIKTIDDLRDQDRTSLDGLKNKLQTNSTKLTVMDVGTLTSIERKEMAWIYNLIATNDDPVVQFFGLIPKVLVLKEKNAAKSFYDLAHPISPQKDQWLIDNCLHGIGIDPQEDTPDSIFEFISTMRDKLSPPVGSVAKDFEIATLDGKKLRLSDFRGKPVLLHFWSTTCGPCVGEFPELEKELRRLKSSHPNFVVLGVSLDDNLNQLNKFLKQYNMQWIAVCDKRGWGGQAAKAFHITSIPSDVVIDLDGKVHGYSRTQIESLVTASRK